MDIEHGFTSGPTAAVVTLSGLHEVRPDEMLAWMAWVGVRSVPHSLLRSCWGRGNHSFLRALPWMAAQRTVGSWSQLF